MEIQTVQGFIITLADPEIQHSLLGQLFSTFYDQGSNSRFLIDSRAAGLQR
jgi:hypothetical protein